MAKENLDALIEKARPQFTDKNIIAFLGEVESGKTVVAALIYYHLSKVWIPQSKGKWEAVPVSGDEAVNEILREMKRGTYTSSTQKNEYPKIVIDVYNMEGQPVKIQLALHDMSGENYAESLSKEYPSEDDRLVEILSGGGAYLAFAKQYVVMVDCGLRKDWDTDICKVARMVSSIREMKRRIHKLDADEKIHASIVVVFTKSDRLLVDDSKKSAEELLNEYPSLHSSLTINHDPSSLAYFKVHVVSKKETEKEAMQRVKKLEEKMQKEFKEKIKTIQQQIDTAVEQAVNTAEKQTRVAGQTEDQIKAAIEIARQKTLEGNKDQLNVEEPKLSNREEELEPTWKVGDPFTYSESEYSKLISWILSAKQR